MFALIVLFAGYSISKSTSYCLTYASPAVRSFWTLTGSPSLLHHPTLVSLARSASCTPAQVVFRLAQKRGIVPLSGSTNQERMKQGLESSRINLEMAPGSDKAIQYLSNLIGGH